MKRQTIYPRVPTVVGGIDEAIAADPLYEWRSVGKSKELHRKVGTSKVEPWAFRMTAKLNEPVRVEFTTRLHGATVAVVVLAGVDGPGAVSIHVEPPDGDQLDPKVFTRLGLGAIFQQIHRDMASPFFRYQLQKWGGQSWLDPFTALPRPGRKGRPDIDYAVWAEKYVTACTATSGRPMPLLEKQNPGFTAGTMRDILHAARYRGLLTKSKPGRAGGKLTTKALALLKRYNGPTP